MAAGRPMPVENNRCSEPLLTSIEPGEDRRQMGNSSPALRITAQSASPKARTTVMSSNMKVSRSRGPSTASRSGVVAGQGGPEAP